MSQLNVLPCVFRTELPQELELELRKCKTDADAIEVGVEWCVGYSLLCSGCCREHLSVGKGGVSIEKKQSITIIFNTVF